MPQVGHGILTPDFLPSILCLVLEASSPCFGLISKFAPICPLFEKGDVTFGNDGFDLTQPSDGRWEE